MLSLLRLPVQGNDDYRKKIHCLLYPNCNHHVAHCLNMLRYEGWSRYEMFQLWFMVRAPYLRSTRGCIA